MNPIKLTIHATGMAICALTGAEADGLTVTFDDATVREQHLSWKAFRQLLSMKTGQVAVRQTVRNPIAELVNNGK